MKVQLDIERLTVEGLNLMPVQRQQVQLAFEQEIARLIDERGLSPHLTAGGAMPSIKSAPIQALTHHPMQSEHRSRRAYILASATRKRKRSAGPARCQNPAGNRSSRQLDRNWKRA